MVLGRVGRLQARVKKAFLLIGLVVSLAGSSVAGGPFIGPPGPLGDPLPSVGKEWTPPAPDLGWPAGVPGHDAAVASGAGLRAIERLVAEGRRLAGPAADSPLPTASVPVAEWLGLDAATTESLVEALGPDLTALIATLRHLQSSDVDEEQLRSTASSLIPMMAASSPAADLLPHDDRFCPLGPENPLAADGTPAATPAGAYGANGGICITGAQDGTYIAGENSFGANRGLFIDLGGNDAYQAGSESFGASSDDAFGTLQPTSRQRGGIFVDLDGHDRYIGTNRSFGYLHGMFFEHTGDDFYLAPTGKAFGCFMGAFVDFHGYDTYEAGGLPPFSGELRSDSFGASPAALLSPSAYFADLQGNDTYSAYRGAFGINGPFLDLEGSDSYVASAESFASGIGSYFVDAQGDDRYKVRGTETFNTFGSGALGNYFADLGGNDTYTTPGSGAFGAGSGFFLDWGGNDTYNAAASAGFGGLLGAFIDTEDPDQRGEHNGEYVLADEPDVVTAELPSPVTLSYQRRDRELDPNIQVGLDLTRAVIPLDSPTAFPGTVSTNLPIELRFEDSKHFALDVSPEGSAAGREVPFPGFFFTNGADTAITATYQPRAAGLQQLIVKQLAPGTEYELRRRVLGTVYVDDEPPELAFDFTDGSGDPEGDVPSIFHSEQGPSPGLTVTADDGVAGLWRLYVKLGSVPNPQTDDPVFEGVVGADGRSSSGNASYEIPLDDLPEGELEYFVLAVDAVGNGGGATYELNIDRTPPDVSVSVVGGRKGENGWYVEEPQVWLTLADALAGPDSFDYSWSGATGAAEEGIGYGGPTEVSPLGGYGQGRSFLKVTARDAAHAPNARIAPGLAMVAFDDAPPTTSDNATQDQIYPVPVGLSANDAASGVGATYFKAWRDGTPEPNYVLGTGLVLSTPGTWNLVYFSRDVAGNDEPPVRKSVRVHAVPPAVAFTFTPSQPRTSDTIQFVAHASDADGRVVAWSWDFGDGNTSTAATPIHRYVSNGNYAVRLTVTDDDGASAMNQSFVTVLNVPPVARFSRNPSRATTLDTVEFIDSSTDVDGRIAGRSWSFGDGSAQSGATARHRYPVPGSYLATLTATDDDGGSNSTSALIVVVEPTPPTSRFSVQPESPTAVDTVAFRDLSDGEAPLASWSWTFGDGSTSTLPNPTHRFPDDGSYTVRLVVTDVRGLTHSSSKVVTVAPVAPTASFTVSSTLVDTGTIVWFNSTSSDPDGPLVTWSWDFGDGVSAAGPRVTHVFLQNGTYGARLLVTDTDGLTAQRTVAVTVRNRAPLAVIAEPTGPLSTGQALNFTSLSTDPDGALAAHAWTFGDGNGSTLRSPLHAYARAGTYAVRLMVTDDDGATSNATRVITVRTRPPTAGFSFQPAAPTTADTVAFLDNSTDPDGFIVAREWSFGDGSGATTQAPSHRYSNNGTFSVRLRVTDDNGASTERFFNITVSNLAPTGVPSAHPARPQTGQSVSFTANATDADGTVASVRWDFGDGQGANGTSVAHAYRRSGTFTVTLTLTDDDGATTTNAVGLQVANRPPLADFLHEPQGPLAGQVVRFVDVSTDPDGEVASRRWTFGDGTESRERNATHAFARRGSFEVQLTVTDMEGSSASRSRQIAVGNQPPRASIVAPTVNATVGQPVLLDDESEDPDGVLLQRLWDWGDGSTTRDNESRHAYARPGTFNVTLTVTDSDGATHTASLLLVVVPGESSAGPAGTAAESSAPGVEATALLAALAPALVWVRRRGRRR